MDETEIDLRAVFGLLRRQFRLIFVTVLAVISVAGFVVFSLTPIYTASSLIMVDPTRKNLLDPQAQLGGAGNDNARLDSEVEILRSDNILLKVIAQENLTAEAHIGVSYGVADRLLAFLRIRELAPPTGEQALSQALNRLRDAITVQRRGLTYLIAIQVSTPDPVQAASLSNAVARAYIEDQVTSKISSTLASRDILEQRIIQARDFIVSAENSFDEFIDRNVDRISTQSDENNLSNLQSQIRTLNEARERNTALARSVQNSLEREDWQSVVASLESSALEELERQRTVLARRLEGTISGSVTAVDLQKELQDIEDRMRRTAASEVNTLQQTVAASQNQEEALRQDLRQAIISSNLPADVLTELYGLQQNSELARAQYQALLSRVQDLETQADLQIADSRVVSPALPPQIPSFPNHRLILALAGAAAISIGVALAFLYEHYIGGFTSEAQLGSVLKTRVAAAVPKQKVGAEEIVPDILITSPLSVLAESIRRLRAAVEQCLRRNSRKGQQGGKVIMVSSSLPNEGKTTLSLSLARSFALSGRKVLLIDCDLRKPTLHRQLNLEPSYGLLDYLCSDEADLGAILSKDSKTTATIVLGARRSDLPTDQLLGSESFDRLITAATRAFDIVVLDTPPVGAVVDGLYLARFADVIVFATLWAATSQRDAKEAINSLREVSPDTQFIAVINQQEQTRGSHIRKYGEYYAEVS